METAVVKRYLVTAIVIGLILSDQHLCEAMTRMEKRELRDKASEMFHHAYRSYMDNAYPADELMPLSCKGRYRGTHPTRGDIDDALGNFSLTLIDTLDTLVVLGEVEEFEKAVRLVINDVRFDSDIVVSVFETNIRVVGGLLGGHLMSDFVKRKLKKMLWYTDELLKMAQDLGDRLIPAFNTSTGMPYPRVNLRYGVKHEMSRTGSEKDTCTACAGTMLLEFSALSRLTGNKIYEDKAARAMDYLWESRHRASDLVGTVINIHNGDWVRRESGIGAGIDSYYEYLLKGYIMLGKDIYLDRFNKHYKAVMKYVSNGPLMLDVHMHRPQMNSRNFMDSLLAFWPGLQVLKGDLKSAIEIHEMLYQVTLRHNFLPEAFTTDFRVHWAQHPLRPEFLESTYFIYKATGDPYYLEVGKSVIENLDRHARVPCGFAAIKDVTTGTHEDQMDSYVLAETFKYLYLLFSEKEDLILNVDDYVFTTEAHLLPLFLSMPSATLNRTEESEQLMEGEKNDEDEGSDFHNTCPSTNHQFKGKIDFAHHLRSPLKNMVENLCPKPKSSEARRLRATEFMAGNKDQLALLNRMGIRIVTMSDGRVQLLHLSNEASSPEDSAEGLLFMQEMIELSKAQTNDASLEPRVVQLMSPPFFGSVVLKAGPAQFGVNLKNHPGIEGQVAIAEPLRGCQSLSNQAQVANKFVMVERGDCMFVDKARHLQNAGAIGGIIFDNNSQSSADSSPLFSMSGDGKADIIIPLVFLFHSEAKVLQESLVNNPYLVVYVSERFKKSDDVLLQYLSHKSRGLVVGPPTSVVGNADGSAESEIEEDDSAADSTSASDSASGSEMEKTVKELIVILLRKIRLETLEPFVRRRSRDKQEARLSGAFQVRVIRMPEDKADSVRMEIPNEEEGQRVVRVVFTEFLLLLMECSNLAQVKDLSQVMDALARLTESVFTNGRMGYGVHTEMLISSLGDRLIMSEKCSKVLFPVVPDVNVESGGTSVADEEGAYLSSESARVKFSVSDGDATVSESQALRKFVRKFVEDQLEVLVKELMMTSSEETSEETPVVVTAGPLTPQGTTREEEVQDDGGLLFLNGYRLDNVDRLTEIKRQINVPSGSSEEGSSAADRDVFTVCDADAAVGDGETASDAAGAQVVMESGGLTWKLRGNCWSVERTGSAEGSEGEAREGQVGKIEGVFRWESDTLRSFTVDDEATVRDVVHDFGIPVSQAPSSELNEYDENNKVFDSFYEKPTCTEGNRDDDGVDSTDGALELLGARSAELDDEKWTLRDKDQILINDHGDRVVHANEEIDSVAPEMVQDHKTTSDEADDGTSSIEDNGEKEILGSAYQEEETSRSDEADNDHAYQEEESTSRGGEADDELTDQQAENHLPDASGAQPRRSAPLEPHVTDYYIFDSNTYSQERRQDNGEDHQPAEYPMPSLQTINDLSRDDRESVEDPDSTTNPASSNLHDYSSDSSKGSSSSSDAEYTAFTSEDSASSVRTDDESSSSLSETNEKRRTSN